MRELVARHDGVVADLNRELADFLRRARAGIDPTRAGLPPGARVRRVAGLRREEVALLAGVSADYYTKLEQGRRITPTPAVVDAVARALDLDPAGLAHLRDLVGAPARARRVTPTVQRLRPGLRQLLDALEAQPALVLGRRTDVLAANRLASALFADFDAVPPRERNYVRWLLQDDAVRSLFVDWEVQARAAVESLRLDLGRHPGDPLGEELVSDLTARSPHFGRWWDEHGVHQRTHGTKRLHHPLAGDLTVDFETLTLPGDADQTLFLYSTEPGSPSRQAMDLLANWSLPALASRSRAAGS